jgi:hypothetical protein
MTRVLNVKCVAAAFRAVAAFVSAPRIAARRGDRTAGRLLVPARVDLGDVPFTSTPTGSGTWNLNPIGIGVSH